MNDHDPAEATVEQLVIEGCLTCLPRPDKEGAVRLIREAYASQTAELAELWKAFRPVVHWYAVDGDGQACPFPEMLSAAIEDLQSDRKDALQLGTLKAELASLKQAYEHGLKTLWDGVTVSALEDTDIYKYVIAELAAAKAEVETQRQRLIAAEACIGDIYAGGEDVNDRTAQYYRAYGDDKYEQMEAETDG